MIRIIFCLLAWLVIIPLCLDDVDYNLEKCEQHLQQIKQYGEALDVQRDF